MDQARELARRAFKFVVEKEKRGQEIERITEGRTPASKSMLRIPVVHALVMAEAEEEALQILEPLRSTLVQVHAFTGLCRIFAEKNNRTQAVSLADAAVSCPEETPDFEIGVAAITLAQSDFPDQARVLAEKIKHEGLRLNILYDLAKILARKQLGNQVLEILLSIPPEQSREYSLREIAVELARTGLYDAMNQVLDLLQDKPDYIRNLARIIEDLLKTGAAKTALEIYTLVSDEKTRQTILPGLILASGRAGLVEEVLALVSKNRNYWILSVEGAKAIAMSAAAWELARLGRFSETRKLLNQAIDTTRIAEYDFGRSVRADKSKALGNVVMTLYKIGDSKKAFKVLNEIESQGVRAVTLSRLSEISSHEGDQQSAIDLGTRASEAAAAIPPSLSTDFYLWTVAVTLARAGQIDAAISTAERIVRPEKDSHNVAHVLDLYGKARLVEKSESFVNFVTSQWRQANANLQISQNLKAEHQRENLRVRLAEAFSCVEQEKKVKDQVRLLSQLSLAWHKIGDEKESMKAFDVAQRITDEMQAGWEKVSALNDIARIRFRTGSISAARDLAQGAFDVSREITDPLERSAAVTETIVALSDTKNDALLQEAIALFEKTLAEIADQQYQAKLMHEFARVLCQIKKCDTARAFINRLHDGQLQRESYLDLAQAFAEVNNQQEAVRCVEDALANAFRIDRIALWKTLGQANSIIAAIDGGDTLITCYSLVSSVEDWWV
jgi:tetratricopeptide (TPR) repeat protein